MIRFEADFTKMIEVKARLALIALVHSKDHILGSISNHTLQLESCFLNVSYY